jgi:hypothetical protein
VEPTKAGDGKFLKLELQVLNGPFQNRKVFDRLNIWNKNPQAVTIAQGTLSAICRAVGVLTPQDSSDLHNKPLRCKVVVRIDKEYGETNDVKRYMPRTAGPGAAGAMASANSAKADNNDPRNSSFSSIQNTTRQGVPVPVIFGRRIVGSVVISGAIFVDQVAA